MMYADTSALVKLVVQEEGSNALNRYINEHKPHLNSCTLTITELHRAATRGGAVQDEAIELLLGQIDLLDLDRMLLVRAGHLPSPPDSFMRSADAIHLAAAMELGATDFLTYDKTQGKAAAAAGFTVIAPQD